MKPNTPKKTTKGDKMRQRILETASTMMAEKGPDAVSMREISARLKITKPVLYYYFKDTDALYEAVLDEVFSGLRARVMPVLESGLPPRRKMPAVQPRSWAMRWSRSS